MRLNLIFILFVCIVIASDQIPAPNQDHPIIISGATIHTVSHGVLENAEILFDGGLYNHLESCIIRGEKPSQLVLIIIIAIYSLEINSILQSLI